MSHESRTAWLDAFRQDVSYAVRSAVRNPGLFAAVVVTAALGIGANGALFSLLDRLYIRPPSGVTHPEQLHRLYFEIHPPAPALPFVRTMFSYSEVRKISSALPGSTRIAFFANQRLPVGTGTEGVLTNVTLVGGDYFGLLGVPPAKGRLFTTEELRVDTPFPVAVLSDRYWRARFSGDSSAIGARITVGTRIYTIIGVATRGFDGIELSATDVWVPSNHLTQPGMTRPWYASELEYNVQLLLRIPASERIADVIERAHVGLGLPAAPSAHRSPLLIGPILAARGPGESPSDTKVASRLLAVTLLVLVVACANVANLLLTRSARRRAEMSVRVALGLSRARLTGQLMVENLALAGITAGAALYVSWLGGRTLRRLLMPEVVWPDGPLDTRLIMAIVSAAIVTVLISASPGLLRDFEPDLGLSLRTGAPGIRGGRLRGSLVVVQATLSVVLLVGAGLFLKSLRSVQRLDLGFDVPELIIAGFSTGARDVGRLEQGQVLARLLPRIDSLPGVTAAALSNTRPFGGLSFTALFIEGRTALPRNEQGIPTFVSVTPRYFQTTGIALLAGRSFSHSDNESAQRVAIVNQTMAKLTWPGESALGKCIRLARSDAACTTVVGVVANARRSSVIETPAMIFYIPAAQATRPTERFPATLLVRAPPSDQSRLISLLRTILAEAMPGARADITPLGRVLAPQLRPWRVGAQLFSAFGILALLVSAIGVFSATAYAVSQRTREIGIRLAVGARRIDVVILVIAMALRWAGFGAVLGVAAAVAGGRFVQSLLYGTWALDPTVLVGAASGLVLVAILGALAPAQRAASIDPTHTLKAE
jgi:predicted permease